MAPKKKAPKTVPNQDAELRALKQAGNTVMLLQRAGLLAQKGAVAAA